jgi:2,5-diamino-6-(ribosylamino)-4(3H)-pyrimidinone 5'-phosphate reductase
MVDEEIHIAINMAMSADGKITTRKREQIVLGTSEDRRTMDVLRSRCDAVIVGAGTVRHDGYPVLVRDTAVRSRRTAQGLPPHPANVILSRSLNLPMDRKIFSRKDTEKIFFTTREARATRIRRFSALGEVIVLAGNTVRPRAVVKELAKRGLNRILIEGGGEVNFSFTHSGLVDELYITITPRLIGGRTAPSVIDGAGFLKKDHRKMKLISCRRVDDELFLHYQLLK